jgi:hypothetical protein
MARKTFNIKRIVFAVNGIAINGFSDEEISIETDEDLYEKKVGISGEVARARKNNRTGKVTFNLLYTSPDNQIFNNLRSQDQRDDSGYFEILIEDSSGAMVFRSSEAWIMKDPNVTLGVETPTIEWVCDCGQIEMDLVGIA